MSKQEKPTAIDLFCGAGGMSLGFERAGFEVAAAVDVDPIHVSTYARHFPDTKAVCADLTEISGEELRAEAGLQGREIDVLFGGPPCQGFSIGGKRQADDPRNVLMSDFARMVSELRPRHFVVENVTGLMMGASVRVLESFVDQVYQSGYAVILPIQVLDACDFGVPQRRRRVFILGYREDQPAPQYPRPLTDRGGDRNGGPPTVGAAIHDLPNIDDFEYLLDTDVYEGELGTPSDYVRMLRGEPDGTNDSSAPHPGSNGRLTGCLRTRHTPTTVKRFAATEPGTYEPVSRFYRLAADGLAHTLRAGSGKSHGGFTAPRPIHPVWDRCITVREAARLHSFPDWFCFHPTKWHGFRQVGNSVPPLLGKVVAGSVKRALTRGVLR